MKRVVRGIVVAAALTLLGGTADARRARPLEKCPVDSVVSGTVCMDAREASVWRVANPTTSNEPGALQRGGTFDFGDGSGAGPLAINALNGPSRAIRGTGFRCAR